MAGPANSKSGYCDIFIWQVGRAGKLNAYFNKKRMKMQYNKFLFISGVLALMTCTNNPNSSQDGQLMQITNQTIVGNWIGQNTIVIHCLGGEAGTAIIECQYRIYTDSIVISRDKILSASCGVFEDTVVPTHPRIIDSASYKLIKTFWKLQNDSLCVFNEERKLGVYDTVLINVINLIPYSSNKIIFKTSTYSDICQKQ
jgi:hypothetical protein